MRRPVHDYLRTFAARTGLLMLPALFLAGLLAPPARADVEVQVANFAFEPRDVTISVGETVTWVWSSGSHTTTNGTGFADPEAGLLWDETISSGSPMFSYTFEEEGVVPYFCRPHEEFDMVGSVTVEAAVGIGDAASDGSGNLPRGVDVSQNFPNPFNPSTSFSVRIPDGASRISSLRIFTLRGEAVRTVFDSVLHPGEYTFSWNGTNDRGKPVASGIYIYRLTAGDEIVSKKMTLLK